MIPNILIIKSCVVAFFLSVFSVFSQEGEEVCGWINSFKQYENVDLEKAQEYANKAVLVSKDSNDSICLFKSYYYLGKILYQKREIATAEKAIKASLKIVSIFDDKKYLLLNYLCLGEIEGIKNNHEKSLQFFEKALKIAKQGGFKNLSHEIIICKAILLQQIDKREQSFSLIYSIKKEVDSVNVRAMLYGTLGALHLLKNKDSSIYYYKKVVPLSKELGNPRLERVAMSNLGNVLMITGEHEQALEYLKKSKEKAIAIKDFKGLHYLTLQLGLYDLIKENYKKAVEKYMVALNKYGKYVDDTQRAHVYWLLSGALWHDEQFKEAYFYQEKYIELKDSLFTIEKNKTFERLQTEYEVEKKNDQITHLQEKQELEAKQRKLILGVGGLVSGILLLLVFMYRYRSRSQKTIREKEQQLFLQEKEQLQQSEKIKRIEGYIEGEEKEKNRIAMELHDGIGGQLAGIQHFVATLPKSTATGVLRENISMISKEVRLLSHSLSSSFSEIQPLTHLLQTLQSQYQNHFDLQINVYPEEEIKNLSTTQKVFLYRSIQEIINNIYKHADATSVVLSLTISEEVVLMIEDNGKGFDMHKTAKGIGLQNIKDKTAYAKGEITIDSKLGQGTTVIIKIQKEHEEDKYSSS